MSQLTTLSRTSSLLSLGYVGPRLGACGFLFEAALRLRHSGARLIAALSSSVLKAHVFGGRYNLQVFNPIVGAISVDVVDEFGSEKRSANVFGHYKTMFSQVAIWLSERVLGPVKPDIPVMRINDPAALPERVFRAGQAGADVGAVFGRELSSRQRFGDLCACFGAALRHVNTPFVSSQKYIGATGGNSIG